MELRGTTTIVTGAGGRIGRAIALEFARQGAAVVCLGRREQRLRETVELIERAGGRAMSIRADVTVRAAVDAAVEQTLGRYGTIDVLFNNAGSFGAIGGLWEVDPDDWWHDVTVNLLGPMLCTRAVLKHMMQRDRGLIINMNGGGSTSPLAGGSAYGSSKAALLRLTDTLARELQTAGSRVIVVAMGPGFVRTEMTQLQADTDSGRRWLPGSKAALDEGRDRPPEDCAKATVELLRHLRPEFSGRIFSVDQNFSELAERAPQLAQQDLFTLRFKSAHSI